MNDKIFDYGFRITGKSHEKRNLECQDAFQIRRLENGWYVGAVADGVGSCRNAAAGSALAAKTMVDFVCECMPYDYSLISIKSMLRTAMNYTLKTILRQADEENPVETFDTTLSLVIYDGKRIIYAHSGDGAIIGLTSFGELVEITTRQKGEDGVSMIPLRAGYTRWEIDHYEEDLAGVFLVTDGVLDALSPYLLKIRSSGSGLYIPLASWLADPAGIPDDSEGREVLRERMEAFVTADPEYDSEFFYERLEEIYKARVPEQAEELLKEIRLYNYPVSLMQGSEDDKTVVGFLNPDVPVESQGMEYYREPDWWVLQETWNRLAYPSRYEKKAEDEDTTPKEMFVKWMKKWIRLDTSEDCEVKQHEGNEESEGL